MKASWGISTFPTIFKRFLPFFCFYPREVSVEVVNAAPERAVPVELWIDGALAASRIETLTPGTKARLAFTVRPGAGGERRLEVRVPPDRYPADDRRHLALEVAPPLGVLVVDGDTGASDAQGETFFLQEALRHERLAATVPVRIGVAGPEAPDAPVPEGTAVVVLANVRAPGEEAGRRLVEHVSAGGGLLVFWGAACDAEAWRRALPGLLPAPVEGTAAASPGSPWRAGAVDLAAPRADGLRAAGGGDLRHRLVHAARAARAAGAARAGARALRGRRTVARRAACRARACRLRRLDRGPRGQRPADACGRALRRSCNCMTPTRPPATREGTELVLSALHAERGGKRDSIQTIG